MARKRLDDKRQRILQAAVKVFARKGVENHRFVPEPALDS